MTGRVRDLISDPKETGKLGEVIAEGSYYGMQTFDQALLKLYEEGKISMDEALKAATHPHDFKLLVAAEGQRSTSVDQIYSRTQDHPTAARPARGDERLRSVPGADDEPQRHRAARRLAAAPSPAGPHAPPANFLLQSVKPLVSSSTGARGAPSRGEREAATT